jgi:hypothetical protein
MVDVSKIGWTWHTAAAEGSGTDARVTIRVRRDGQQLAYVNEEPGETDRLDRGSQYESWWTFVNPTGIGTAVSGKAVPYTEPFPEGVVGHLTIELEVHGDDKWRWEYIGVHVVEGKKAFIPGTIDGWVWAESATTYHFQYDRSMSTDSGEGYRRITLKI